MNIFQTRNLTLKVLILTWLAWQLVARRNRTTAMCEDVKSPNSSQTASKSIYSGVQVNELVPIWRIFPQYDNMCMYDPHDTVAQYKANSQCINARSWIYEQFGWAPALFMHGNEQIGAFRSDQQRRRTEQDTKIDRNSKPPPPPNKRLNRNLDPSVVESRRAEIVNATKYAFQAYRTHAWGYDELKPVSKTAHNEFGGMGATIVDSLTTLYIMGLEEEYLLAREWVANELNFETTSEIIFFETVIRILGGLTSMYHLSGDSMYLSKAEELAWYLSFAFKSESGVPLPRCMMKYRRCYTRVELGQSIPLAEAGTIQLEFRALSASTNSTLIKDMQHRADVIFRFLEAAKSKDHYHGVLPVRLSVKTHTFVSDSRTVGAPADSFYEYLYKIWVQGGYQEQKFFEMFRDVVEDVLENFVMQSPDGYYHLCDRTTHHVIPRMDHFSCFFPAVLISAAQSMFSPLSNQEREEWTELAEALTETCHEMYSRSLSGLSGENVRFHKAIWTYSGQYELRPEAIEAFFFMWRHTHDPKYRDYAWSIFEKIIEHCLLEDGSMSNLINPRSRHPKKGDVMHSFLFAETFKYLYLIFSEDELLDFSNYVLNTEAHPFLISPSISLVD